MPYRVYFVEEEPSEEEMEKRRRERERESEGGRSGSERSRGGRPMDDE